MQLLHGLSFKQGPKISIVQNYNFFFAKAHVSTINRSLTKLTSTVHKLF